MSEATRTNVRLPAATSTGTTHAPMAAEIKVTIEPGRDGSWAGLVIEWTAPRPVAVVLKD
jgi:hypothetical protein